MPGKLRAEQQPVKSEIRSAALSDCASRHLPWRPQQVPDLARRWIHYAWRHWDQIQHVPGMSWHRIGASSTMVHIDQELTCKVALHPLLPVPG